MTGLLLSDDLIFTSRIVGTAADLGLTVRVARSSAALTALAGNCAPTFVIVDLANPGLSIAELAKQLKCITPAPNLIAYGSHVDTETLKAARSAGFDKVMPRSQFVELLPVELPHWATPGQ